MRRLAGLVAATLLAGSVLAESAVDAERQAITIALATEPPTLNSVRATDAESFGILDHISEGLMRYDRHGQLVGGVAEHWEVTDSGAIFQLRHDARWSDGQPVTAHDFVFAWQQLALPASAAPYAYILYPVRNAERINKGELPVEALGVKAVDDYTLRVEFEQPCAYFLQLTAFISYRPIRKDFYLARGQRYAADAEDMLFNGPFRLAEWVHGASLRLEKNPHYWNRQAIRLNTINAAYITDDPSTQINLFKDGKIALAGLDGATVKSALQERMKIRKFVDGVLFYLEFNHRPGRPTANLKLRQAIQLVFDSNELVNRVVATPGNQPAYSLFPAWVPGEQQALRREYPPPRIKPDITRARELLAQAAEEMGVTSLPPLVLLLGDSPGAGKQGEYLQNLLSRALGLELILDKQVFKQRLDKLRQGQFELAASGWGPDYNDAMTFADLFASWNDNNHGGYGSEQYDHWIRQAQGTTDAGVRAGAFAKIQQMVSDQVIMLPMYERGAIYVQTPRLKGVVRRIFGGDPNYNYAYVE
jgi:oligopeptide transport system substrate-binding protein